MSETIRSNELYLCIDESLENELVKFSNCATDGALATKCCARANVNCFTE